MKRLLAIVLLAGCAQVPQKPVVPPNIPAPQIIEVGVPVRCVKQKPVVPKTSVTAAMLAQAEVAVNALQKPPPEITKEQLSEWIGSIDRVVSALFADFYRMKQYIADADPLLIACSVDPEPTKEPTK